jgi:hypothetical protein
MDDPMKDSKKSRQYTTSWAYSSLKLKYTFYLYMFHASFKNMTFVFEQLGFFPSGFKLL